MKTTVSFLSLAALTFLFTFSGASKLLGAQPFSPGAPELLTEKEGEILMHPVWSPDGGQVAFTAAGFRGIWTVSDEGGEPVQITDSRGAGYGMKWSSDGSSIVSRTARYEEQHRLHAITVYDIEAGTENRVKEYSRQRTGLPDWTDLDRKIAVSTPESVLLLESGLEPAERSKRIPDESVIMSRDNRIEKMSVSEQQSEAIKTFDQQRILNTTASPDGRLVAYQVMGEGLFVMDHEGENSQNLGRGEHPVWTPDGSWILAMVTEDDGHRITGSELYAIDPESGERHPLTSHIDLIAMYPTVAPEADRIAFSDYESGRIYTMSIR